MSHSTLRHTRPSHIPIPPGYAATVFDAATQTWYHVPAAEEGWDDPTPAASRLSPRLAAAARFPVQDWANQKLTTRSTQIEPSFKRIGLIFVAILIGAIAALIFPILAHSFHGATLSPHKHLGLLQSAQPSDQK